MPKEAVNVDTEIYFNWNKFDRVACPYFLKKCETRRLRFHKKNHRTFWGSKKKIDVKF